MCGRLAQVTAAGKIVDLFDIINELGDMTPRYNIVPTTELAILRSSDRADQLEWKKMRWGLIPRWSKTEPLKIHLFNARAETVAEKPSFRHAYRKRRCVIPVDGFYEWKRENNEKQPHYFRKKDQSPLLFAGLWEWWTDNQTTIESTTIITTEANQLMASIHHRMPVILTAQNVPHWLNLSNPTANRLLAPDQTEDLETYSVDTYVNNARHEGEACIRSCFKDAADEHKIRQK